jgi:iron complex outermembrane receptor protein
MRQGRQLCRVDPENHVRLMTIAKQLVCCGLLLALGSDSLFAQSGSTSVVDLKKLSMEQLMEISVTSASRTEEPLAGVPAALVVVSNEDIRRSGATSIPEALRLLPGLNVAQQTSSAWAVSARGFSSISSEKLLVLSDTRSLYTPLFSGVFWDVQNYLTQDIDRIEVIRGPGATLWGANAVNGVVNITTKSAKDTQGLYFTTASGTADPAEVATRYGGRIAEGAYYRVFAKFSDHDATFHPAAPSSDQWRMANTGFRADWDASPADAFTLQGDLYSGQVGQITPALVITGRPGPTGQLRADVGGGNVLGRWRRHPSDRSDLQVRAYFDRTHRDDPTYIDTLDTFDIDLQHRFLPAERHELTWGAAYHSTWSDVSDKGIVALAPPNSHDTVFSGFVQDQIHIASSLHVTAGTKIEHNDFSGVEIQPSARLAWDADGRQTVWGAVSRAVRVPTRFERDLVADAPSASGGPTLRLQGNPDFDSERLIAYEAGYRWKVRSNLSIDVTAFYNRYRGLASLELGAPLVDPETNRPILPLSYQNLTDGRARGIEALATFAPAPWWRLSASSSSLRLRLDPQGLDANGGRFLEGATPRYQLGVRSYVDLPRGFQLDTMIRKLTAVRQLLSNGPIADLPGYAEMDVRVAWRGWRQTELSLLGQNLLHDRHVEFGPTAARGEIERSLSARLTWGF